MDKNSAQAKCPEASSRVDSSLKDPVTIAKDSAPRTISGSSEVKKPKRKRQSEADRLQADEGVQRMIEEGCMNRQSDRRSNSLTPSSRGRTPAPHDSRNASVPSSSEAAIKDSVRPASPPSIIPSERNTVNADFDAFKNTIEEQFKKRMLLENRLKLENEALNKEKEELIKKLEATTNEIVGSSFKYEELVKQLDEKQIEVASLKSSNSSLKAQLKEEKEERRKEKEELGNEISGWKIHAENERFARNQDNAGSGSVITRLNEKVAALEEEKTAAANDYAASIGVYRSIANERNNELLEVQKKLTAAAEENKKLQTALDEANNKVAAQKKKGEEQQTLLNKKSEASEDIKKYQKSLDDVNNAIVSLKKKAEEQKTHLDKLKSVSDVTIQSLKDSLVKMEKEKGSDMVDYARSIESMNHELTEEKKKLAKAFEEFERQQGSLKEANEEVASLKRKSDEQLKHFEKERMDRLRYKNELVIELKKKCDEIDSMKKTNETLQGDLEQEKRLRKCDLENFTKKMIEKDYEILAIGKEGNATSEKLVELLRVEKDKFLQLQDSNERVGAFIGASMMTGDRSFLAGFTRGALANQRLALANGNEFENLQSSSSTGNVSSAPSSDTGDRVNLKRRYLDDDTEGREKRRNLGDK